MDSSRFSWTQEFRRSWDNVIENESKHIQIQAKPFNPNRKNIIRHLLVCFDTSSAIEKQDYIPTIRSTLSRIIPEFIESFRNENPLSVISFLACRDIFEQHTRQFVPNEILGTVGESEFSFLNCLRSGIEILKNSTYNREILVITPSIGTKDPGSYDQVLRDIKKYNLKISVISICGEVTLFKAISETSGGRFVVPLDHNHLPLVLNHFVEPLEYLESTSCLVKLGFPRLLNKIALCNCHVKLDNQLYECPACKAFVCSLPAQCPVCEMQLVSPLCISKSQYFLFPLKPFTRIATNPDSTKESGTQRNCAKCCESAVSVCEKCGNCFCEACDVFLHDELQFCIFCDT